MKTIDVPVLTDSFVHRIAARSVYSVRREIKNEVGSFVRDFEDWFDGPKQVAVRLADRLACAEECLRSELGFAEYRRLVKEMQD